MPIPAPPRPLRSKTDPYDGGALQLMQWGGSILSAGIVAGLLLVTVLGGFTATGAKTNGGWFAVIVALGCIPFGGFLLLLGVAKWQRNRSESRKRLEAQGSDKAKP